VGGRRSVRVRDRGSASPADHHIGHPFTARILAVETSATDLAGA
jgi:hypothetical protein